MTTMPATSFHTAVGERLKAARKEAGLTQQAVAEEADISRGTVANVENGAQNVTLGALHRLAQAIGIPVGRLFD